LIDALLSRRVLLKSCALLAASGRAMAQATPYPQRPIKVIVPNAPASSVDTIARLVATPLALQLQQAIVIDNKAGAAGALGVEAGRAAPADGYTLIVASSSSLTVAPLAEGRALRPTEGLRFHFADGAVAQRAGMQSGAAPDKHGRADRLGKIRGTASNMSSAGVGSVSHLAGVALQSAAGFQSLHVPYKGGSQGVPRSCRARPTGC
jgi:tripartite-type tricarboxylate transporter receptor subunit TctC